MGTTWAGFTGAGEGAGDAAGVGAATAGVGAAVAIGVGSTVGEIGVVVATGTGTGVGAGLESSKQAHEMTAVTRHARPRCKNRKGVPFE